MSPGWPSWVGCSTAGPEMPNPNRTVTNLTVAVRDPRVQGGKAQNSAPRDAPPGHRARRFRQGQLHGRAAAGELSGAARKTIDRQNPVRAKAVNWRSAQPSSGLRMSPRRRDFCPPQDTQPGEAERLGLYKSELLRQGHAPRSSYSKWPCLKH